MDSGALDKGSLKGRLKTRGQAFPNAACTDAVYWGGSNQFCCTPCPEAVHCLASVLVILSVSPNRWAYHVWTSTSYNPTSKHLNYTFKSQTGNDSTNSHFIWCGQSLREDARIDTLARENTWAPESHSCLKRLTINLLYSALILSQQHRLYDLTTKFKYLLNRQLRNTF